MMTPVKLPALPPCPDGGHVLHPHAHLWHLPGYEKRETLGEPAHDRWLWSPFLPDLRAAAE